MNALTELNPCHKCCLETKTIGFFLLCRKIPGLLPIILASILAKKLLLIHVYLI